MWLLLPKNGARIWEDYHAAGRVATAAGGAGTFED
jgi:hypothetical protein